MTSRVRDSPVVTGDQPPASLVLEVTLEPDDDTAPLRVLSLLARRRCRVHSVAFDHGDGSLPSRMRVELEPRARGEQTVERWVAGLVSVRGVTRAPS